LLTTAIQRQTKPQKDVEEKESYKKRKNVSQDKTRVIPANATTELCHRLENIISRSTL